MSGHSRWSTIKRRKGAQDAQRSRIYSRLSRELAVAVQEGGGTDPALNPRLRLAIQSARAQNMPSARISHAVQRAGGLDGVALEHRTFEGYSTDGIGIFIETETDNINRTVGHVRATLARHGGSLGQDGCLQFAFRQVGRFALPAAPEEVDELLLELIDAGVEDFRHEAGCLWLTTAATAFGAVQEALAALGRVPEEAGLEPCVQVWQPLAEARWSALERLLDALAESEDVRHVCHNARVEP